MDPGFACVLKTLENQESDLKALKVLEIGVWSLKVLDFWSEQDHKILSFRVVSTKIVHTNSMQTSCNASELSFFFFFLISNHVLNCYSCVYVCSATSAPSMSLLFTCFHALVLRSIFKIGSWKVLEKSLNFCSKKVYKPCGPSIDSIFDDLNMIITTSPWPHPVDW